MTDAPTEPPSELERRPTLQGELEAQQLADVHSGRAFEWQAGQDAYERWLNEIAP